MHGHQGGKKGAEMNWEIGIDVCVCVCVYIHTVDTKYKIDN